jgi:type IX secretion system PorP/SprF family membrane protein
MTKTFTLITLCIILSFSISKTFAQDIHYSQFYASPLTLNPALTGINDCSYRISGNYRNQWSSIPAPYSTPSLSFDINTLAPKVITKGNLSAGLLVYNDRSGDGNLNNLSVYGSGGYSINPDVAKKHTVSIGLQLGFSQKRVDQSLLTFEDQYDGSNFTLQTGESFAKNSFGYLNAHAGILWMYKPSENLKVYIGAAAFNLLTPKETFLGSTNELNMRPLVHGGADITLNDKLGLVPSVMYQSQSKSSEINLGTALRYNLQSASNPKLYFGAYFRVGDALIPVVALEVKQFKVGLSYDVNVSSLNDATNLKGGFEISLGFTGCISGTLNVEPIQWCPRF